MERVHQIMKPHVLRKDTLDIFDTNYLVRLPKKKCTNASGQGQDYVSRPKGSPLPP